ncbi:MAG: PP2C family protein-serine/threonine phosphatase [Bacteroidia bacterium]|nr:PP2C family protein-serine/threonine phosphatase [Bacteroidia bacterium]
MVKAIQSATVVVLHVLLLTVSVTAQTDTFQVERILKKQPHDTTTVHQILSIAESIAVSDKDSVKFRDLISKSIDVCVEIKYKSGLSRSYFALALHYYILGKAEYAPVLALQERAAKESGAPDELGKAFWFKALVFENTGKYTESLEYYNLAHEYWKKSNNTEFIMLGIQALSAAHGRNKESFKQHEILMEAYSRLESLPDTEKRKYIRIYGDLSYTQRIFKNYSKAEHFIKIALVLVDTFQINKNLVYKSFPVGLIMDNNVLIFTYAAITFTLTGKSELARIYFELAIQESLRHDTYNISYVYGYKSRMESGESEYSQALQTAETGLDYELKYPSNNNRVVCLISKGLALFGLSQYTEALALSEEALPICSNDDDRLDALSLAAKSARSLQEWKKAAEYAFRYSTLNDSLTNSVTAVRLAEAEMEHRFTLQDQLLVQKNQRIQVQQTFQLALGGCLLLMLGFIGYGITQYRQKVKLVKETQEQKEELRTINEAISISNSDLEKAQVRIGESMNYARTIQDALLPSAGLLGKLFPNHFLLFRPLQTVSGDIYWAYGSDKDDFRVVATIDCTGHGIPGAFMSILAIGLLREIVVSGKELDPATVLDRLDHRLKLLLSYADERRQDGMDISLVVYRPTQGRVDFAGARNDLIVVNSTGLRVYKSAQRSIGEKSAHPESGERRFTTHTFQVTEPTMVYMFSDGYADQFGGETSRKFGYKALFAEFLDVYPRPVEQQHKRLAEKFDNWKGAHPQLDDVLVLGIRLG